MRLRRNSGLQVMALHTSVGPIASSIFAWGHFTTVAKGNMYSFCAIAASGESQCTMVAQQDLREAGTVRLHRGVAAVPLNRRRAAEDEIPAAALEHRRANIASAGVHRNRLARNARLSEGFGHPIRRPRFLRPRLQDE